MASTARDVNPLGLERRAGYSLAMSKADQQREERLAAALRDNLKRRKSQSRESEPKKPLSDTN